MSNQLVKVGKKKSYLQFILEFLGFGKEEEIELVPVIDPKIEYVRKSVKKIQLFSEVLACHEFILDETVSMEQSQVFNDILNITKEVHNRIKNDVNIKPQKLEQFHMYYTENLIALLKTLKHQRDDVRQVPVNSEPYIRRATTHRDNLVQEELKSFLSRMVEIHGEALGQRRFKMDRENFLTELDRRIFFIKHSKGIDRSPIFYTMGNLFKVSLDREDNAYKIVKLHINEGFQIRITGAKEANVNNFHNIRLTTERTTKIDFYSLNQEQYVLMVDYKNKIEDYYINLDGKKEKIELEMNNLKAIINTDMLNLG